MTQTPHNPMQSDREPEETLRLVAQLPSPDGLEDRVHQRLHVSQRHLPARGFWSLWKPAQRLQYAAAAALVLALAGSVWKVYHPAHGAIVIQPAPQSGSPSTPGSGFGTAGAERHPGTLAPIKVPPPPTKKPSAVTPHSKPSPKILAHKPAPAPAPQVQ